LKRYFASFPLPLPAVAPPKPTIPNAIFDITAMARLETGQRTIPLPSRQPLAPQADAGGGIVVVPPASKPYQCGPITLASNLNLQIKSGAMLQCIAYSRYPLTGSAYVNFISAVNVHDIEISGTGPHAMGKAPIGGPLLMPTMPCRIAPI